MKKTFLRVCSLLLIFMLCFSMSSCAAVAALVLVGEVEMAKNTLENGLVPEVDTEWIAPTVSSTQIFKSSTLNATLVELKKIEEDSLSISVEFENMGYNDVIVSHFFVTLNGYTFDLNESQKILGRKEALVTYILPLNSSTIALIGNIGQYDFSLEYYYSSEWKRTFIQSKKFTFKTELYDAWQEEQKAQPLIKTELANSEILEANLLERKRESDSYFEVFFAFTNKTNDTFIASVETVKINDVPWDMGTELFIPAQTTVLYPVRLHVSLLETMEIQEIQSVSADFKLMDRTRGVLTGGILRCTYSEPISVSNFEK